MIAFEQGQGLHADRDLDDTSHHNLLAFPYFNFMALTSIRPMSCGCHMQLGKVSVADARLSILSHLL